MLPTTVWEQRQAEATCRTCPVFDECCVYLESRPIEERPIGVIACVSIGVGNRLPRGKGAVERKHQRRTYARIAAQYAVATYNETIMFVVHEFDVGVRTAARMVARAHSLHFSDSPAKASS